MSTNNSNALECYNHGLALASLGKHLEALTWYEQATQLSPNDAKFWFSMGASYIQLMNYAQALICFDKTITLDPDIVEAWANKAYVLVELQEYTKAIEVYQHAAELAPALPQIWNGLGGCYYKLQQFSAGIKYCAKAIEVDPNFFSAWSNLGWLYLSSDYPKESYICFQKALEIKPDYTNALLGLEQCQEYMREHKIPLIPDAEQASYEIEVGQLLIGRYEIRRIYKGGMGLVYASWDRQMRQMVALKTFQPQFFFNQRAIDLFHAEAINWMKLGWHPNIVSVYWVELIYNRPFIVMPYVEGQSLRQWLDTKDLSLIASIDFAIQFCTGMSHVAECDLGNGQQGLIHRDIKPENILIDQQKVLKITDFGLAKVIRQISEEPTFIANPLVHQSGVAGTLPYMSPEQLQPTSGLDVRSDIFSFGIVLYEMLTNVRPFHGYTSHELLREIENQQIVPPTELNPQVSSALAKIVLQCLKLRPSERFSSFRELRDALVPSYLSLVGHAYPEEKLLTDVALSAFSNSHEIKLIHAVSLARLHRLPEALALLNEALATDAKNANAWYNKAMILREQHEMEQALSAIEMAEKFENDPDMIANLYIGKAAILIESDRLEESIAVCDLAVALAKACSRPAQVLGDALANKANALRFLNRYQEALTCYNEALRHEPSNELPFYNRGLLLRLMGEWQAALDDEEKALKLNPRSALAQGEKGFVLLLLGRSKEAMQCFQRSIIDGKGSPLQHKDELFLYSETDTLENLGNHARAMDYYDVLTLINPRNSAYWIAKGNCFGELGNPEQAIACYEQAIALDKDNYMPWLNKAAALYRVGNFADALSSITEALRLNPAHQNAQTLHQMCEENLHPTNAFAYYDRARVYKNLNLYDKALHDYSQAIQLDPTYMNAYFNRAEIYEELQDYEEALADYSRIIELNQTEAKAYYNRGVIYGRLQRDQAALADYHQALRCDPNLAYAYFNIGAIYCENGQWDKALPYLEKSRDLGIFRGAQYAVLAREKLGIAPTTQVDPSQLAFEAFQSAYSEDEMRQALTNHPLLRDPEFITAIEQTITHQVPPEHRPALTQRLAWLRQIANTQPRSTP